MKDVKSLIALMTLEEKAGLLSGRDFWQTKAVERLGIPAMMMTDGPHGLRKQAGDPDHIGLMASVPATCFPTAAGLACSWDRDLVGRVGEALGAECQSQNVAIVLGPGANIKRSPLCGRNFEYFSEDPVLSGEMAAAHISGVQRMGVGTSLKHFAVNNQETRRLTIDAQVDERTLREIYLASFEFAVKKGKPDTVMCAYNRLNGTYCSENPYLLTKILREEWGFEGFVVSDWGAVTDRVKGVAAGLDLEMPGSYGITDAQVVQAVKDGRLDESDVDTAVERVLAILLFRKATRRPDFAVSHASHHSLAREVAAQCAVLLKNDNALLPLSSGASVAVIGEFARKPRYQGGGSSHVNPTRVDNAYEELVKAHDGNCSYHDGYRTDTDNVDGTLVADAVSAAEAADVAVIFAGLPDRFESEGYDRKHMRLPDCHIALIEAVAAVQPNTVVVLSNGSPVEMPWLHHVTALVESYLGGQAWGGAMADVLTGKTNPGGKLAETFPMIAENNPSYMNFPGTKETVTYHEGVFVGYRWYDTLGITPRFPFGFGLSYTNFEIGDLKLDKTTMTDQETLTATVTVANTGLLAGKEVVQLYVSDPISSVRRPSKELKAFEKVFLQPGESKTVTFALGKRAFAYYSEKVKDWLVESGSFDILVGNSSIAMYAKASIEVTSDFVEPIHVSWNSTVGDLLAHPRTRPVVLAMMEKVTGPDSPMAAFAKENSAMMEAMIADSPLRSLKMFAGPGFDWSFLEEFME